MKKRMDDGEFFLWTMLAAWGILVLLIIIIVIISSN